MHYLSLDLETTGLNEESCQILQLAAVYDDTSRPLEESPTFNVLVWAPIYTGEPYALALNQKILQTLAGMSHLVFGNLVTSRSAIHNGVSIDCVIQDKLALLLLYWLERQGAGLLNDKIVLAGKNVAGFDLRFLRKLPNWDKIPAHHRVFDPGNLYLRPEDTEPPGTEECMRRAGIDAGVTHDALDDALVVCKLIRAWEKNYARS